MGNALLEEQGGKASITKNAGIPRQSLDGVLKASCTCLAGRQEVLGVKTMSTK